MSTPPLQPYIHPNQAVSMSKLSVAGGGSTQQLPSTDPRAKPYQPTTIRTTQGTSNSLTTYTIDLDLIYTVLILITFIWLLIAIFTIWDAKRLILIVGPVSFIYVIMSAKRTVRNLIIVGSVNVVFVILYILVTINSKYHSTFDACYAMWIVIVSIVSFSLGCCNCVRTEISSV